MALIKLEKVSKIYKGGSQVTALDNFSLEINKGEFIAIQGSSGSGKSTLLNILGLLDKPTSGHYLLKDQDTTKFSQKRLNYLRNQEIGFIFQTFNLLGRFSAIDNVLLPTIYSKKKGSRQKAQQALKDVGLEKRINHPPSKLSGGEKQRVAIARALINNPSLILADEPTGNLDSKTGKMILGIISKLHRDKNLTVVLVTHEDDVAQYTQRVINLKDGKIIS